MIVVDVLVVDVEVTVVVVDCVVVLVNSNVGAVLIDVVVGVRVLAGISVVVLTVTVLIDVEWMLQVLSDTTVPCRIIIDTGK